MGYEPLKSFSSDKIIIKVDKGHGKKAGIEVGDILLKVNGKDVVDVFDYRYLIQEKNITVTVKKAQTEEIVTYNIQKGEFDDIDIYFEEGLMDHAKSCKNKCVFCFIDQLPKGMRETLYFKDDDSRLSFLTGNYVTLTNMKEEELDRILFYKLSPINVSVHTTNPELRTFMLKNKNSGKILEYIEKIASNNIEMNFQIVLCKGYNDKEELTKTIYDLSKFLPQAKSLSVVPFGASKYREGLEQIELFNEDDAREVVLQVEEIQKNFLDEYQTRFVFIADEFYLKAKMPLPSYEVYEDFSQIENGVGMMSNFKYEVNDALDEFFEYKVTKRKVGIVTGVASFDFIVKMTQRIKEVYDADPYVIKVVNNFFGDSINITGLLTGGDIIEQVLQYTKENNIELDELLLSRDTLRSDDIVLLDDLTIYDIEKKVETKVRIVESNGYDFVKALLEEE
ncbi:MAG: DUF512 domain-containing protein [Lachnospirales bacterium]